MSGTRERKLHKLSHGDKNEYGVGECENTLLLARAIGNKMEKVWPFKGLEIQA